MHYSMAAPNQVKCYSIQYSDFPNIRTHLYRGYQSVPILTHDKSVTRRVTLNFLDLTITVTALS